MQLTAVRLEQLHAASPLQVISAAMDLLDKHIIGCVPWPAYPCKPDVAFAAACSRDCIFLKYYVSESQIRAHAGMINGQVWEDSCVEFFISFNGGASYYNIELNCIGTALMGYGVSRKHRALLPEETVAAIRSSAVITRTGPGDISWQLTLAIPVAVFVYDRVDFSNGLDCTANFYKCGDMLPQPHFLTWNHVDASHPDFHVPGCFGKLRFPAL